MDGEHAYIEKAQSGFQSLDLAQKYKDAALDWLTVWLTEPAYRDYVPQIEHLVRTENWEFLLDSFYQVIPFGTGGRRGLVGVGPNRINPWTIRASAQGHAQYLLKQYGEDAKTRGVVLAYDVRVYTEKGAYDDTLPNPVMNLDCEQLARAAAEVYAANGIKVHIFDGFRSTPELSFAIRHLKAVSGDMFSASHNPPTDNGKKVYDKFGGQLIPPYDQELVDEVTKNVTDIHTMPIEEAETIGLVSHIGKEVDEKYWDAVCKVSLSEDRGVRIVYSPLHGTGISSVYPILQRLGYQVTLDPQTLNPSGAFENVTFNIPNPEVQESFDTSLEVADQVNADLILNSDPDADRIGVMVKHEGSWSFLNGNEIGVLMSQYGISKFKAKGRLNQDSVIIKSCVTTSLIEKMATRNGAECIGDLLVGFKYVGHEMNGLDEENGLSGFILGTEESHGFLVKNYARDKDAACAAVWIAELAAEQKQKNKTLVDCINEIYAAYGYCHNHLTEIRLTGAKGKERIDQIMKHFRSTEIESFGSFSVTGKVDRWVEGPQPHLSATDTSARNVLVFQLADKPGTQSIKVTVRPSGTEPKVKMYFEVFGTPYRLEESERQKKLIVQIREELERAFMAYCYGVLGVEFPERGFLLFWQLELEDKLHYFEIEDQIAALQGLEDAQTKQQKLDELLKFLGADPVDKVDQAFAAQYGEGIRAYLGL